jgi:hypothetical protein
MYDVATSALITGVYDIGVPPTWWCRVAFRNKTVSNPLSVTVGLPSYFRSSQSTYFQVNPEDIFYFDLIVNETVTRQLGKSRTKFYEEPLTFSVMPMGVTGPVFAISSISPLGSG